VTQAADAPVAAALLEHPTTTLIPDAGLNGTLLA
jgi:hypothetical protein